VVDGSSAELEHFRKLSAYTRDEVSKKIEIPGNFEAPEQCDRKVAPVDAPILAAGFDPSLSELPRLTNEGFREYAFRNLSMLPPDSAVTIRLKLDFPATVDVLASLVWQYQIEGLSAQLVPERSDKRVIAIAELSIHGESLGKCAWVTALRSRVNGMPTGCRSRCHLKRLGYFFRIRVFLRQKLLGNSRLAISNVSFRTMSVDPTRFTKCPSRSKSRPVAAISTVTPNNLVLK